MNQRRNNKGNKRNKGKSLLRDYAAPVLRKIERPIADVSLYYASNVASGVTGLNGIIYNISYNLFSDISEYVGVYKYFEITGYKLDFTNATTEAATDSFIFGEIGLRQLNYVIGETVTATTPSTPQAVADLPGAINVQPGANNRGRWVTTQSKQVYCVRDAVTSARPVFDLIAYFQDVGISETVGAVLITLNVKFYGKEYASAL